MDVLNDIDINELSNLYKTLKSSQIVQLQFTEKKDDNFWKELNTLLNYNPKIRIRFYGYHGVWNDLSCLKLLSNLECLSIGDFELESLHFLKYVKKITELSINRPYKIISVKGIEHLKNLRELYLNGVFKDIDIIPNFKLIENLAIYKPTLSFMESISHFRLKYLSLTKSNFHIHYLNKFELLKDLSLFIIDKSFIDEGLKINIENLEIYSCNIENLNFIKGFKNLKTLSVNTCKKLINFSVIQEMEHLHSLKIYDCDSKAEQFITIPKLKELKKMSIHFKTNKQEDLFDNFLKSK
ncbi:hypothetical protein BH10BAC2_BH10BAC2_12610 [soil metagenome]